MKKYQRTKEGDILMIPLENSFHSYGRVVIDKKIAFYDCKTAKQLSINEIVKCPILFTLTVFKSVHSSLRWIKIGNQPLEEHLKCRVNTFTQDSAYLNVIYLISEKGYNPSTYEECVGLEPTIVWEHKSIEERLEDYFKNVPYRHERMLELKKPVPPYFYPPGFKPNSDPPSCNIKC